MNQAFNIWQRKDGRYEGRITIDGKQISRYGKTEASVIKKLKKLENDHIAGLVLERKSRLDDALEKYLFEHKLSSVKPSTYDRLECTFNNQIKNSWLGRMQYAQVKTADVSRFLSELSQKLSYSSVKKVYSLLGEFYGYMANDDMINKDPMILAKMPHKENFVIKPKDMEVLSYDEIRKVVEVAESVDGDGLPIYRYGEVIVLLILTGLRSGEVRAIRINDIDFDKHILHVRNNISHHKDRLNGGVVDELSSTKTVGSVRDIPLSDRAMVAIRRLLSNTHSEGDDLLITTGGGKILSNQYLERCYGYILKKARVRHMGLHSTRHTFATQAMPIAIKQGKDKEVSELLGHSDITTTFKYYVKADSTSKKTIIDNLDFGL